jgi:hypothetical protein
MDALPPSLREVDEAKAAYAAMMVKYEAMDKAVKKMSLELSSLQAQQRIVPTSPTDLGPFSLLSAPTDINNNNNMVKGSTYAASAPAAIDNESKTKSRSKKRPHADMSSASSSTSAPSTPVEHKDKSKEQLIGKAGLKCPSDKLKHGVPLNFYRGSNIVFFSYLGKLIHAITAQILRWRGLTPGSFNAPSSSIMRESGVDYNKLSDAQKSWIALGFTNVASFDAFFISDADQSVQVRIKHKEGYTISEDVRKNLVNMMVTLATTAINNGVYKDNEDRRLQRQRRCAWNTSVQESQDGRR